MTSDWPVSRLYDYPFTEMYTFYFEKLEVWKDAIQLIKEIYRLTLNFPDEEKFGIISQIRRAAVSISTNLSEGSGRMTSKDQANFTTNAYSSLMEVLNLLLVSLELSYVEEKKYLELRESIEMIANKLNALRNSQLGNN